MLRITCLMTEMLEDNVTFSVLELQMYYIMLHETHQSSVKMRPAPQHLSQNGAVVDWALMHQGCALLSDRCSRSAKLNNTCTQRHRQKCGRASIQKHTQRLNNCIIARTHVYTQRNSSSLHIQTHRKKRHIDVLSFCFSTLSLCPHP